MPIAPLRIGAEKVNRRSAFTICAEAAFRGSSAKLRIVVSPSQCKRPIWLTLPLDHGFSAGVFGGQADFG